MAMQIVYAVAREIAEHAMAQAPREACGILAGQGSRISKGLPVHNIAPAPRLQFQLDPVEQLKALKTIDALGLNWIGVYHSHPRTAPIPSDQDIAACVDQRLLHLIVSLDQSKPRFKLWRIERSSVLPIELAFDTETARDIDRPLSTTQQAAIVAVGIAALLLLLVIAFNLLPPAPALALAS